MWGGGGQNAAPKRTLITKLGDLTFSGLGSRTSAANKPKILICLHEKQKEIKKKWIVCLETGLHIQLNFKVMI